MKTKKFTRLTLLVIAIITGAASSNAQKIIRHADGSYYRQCSSFSISKSVKELSEMESANEEQVLPAIEAGDSQSDRAPLIQSNPDALPKNGDPARQSYDGTRTMNTDNIAAPLVNFAGSIDSYLPCDPSGAAGPNHYVQAVNCKYRVFSKTGTALAALTNLSTLFGTTAGLSDPVVLYDKFADRWLITMLNTSASSTQSIFMAVSTTADPTGTYYVYTFDPQPGTMEDYPKFSIWSDGYYMVCNTGTEKVAVYERAKMLTGDNTAGMVVSNLTGIKRTSAFFCPVSLDADGQLPPNGSPNYVMSYEDDSWGSSYKDQLDIVKITVNWTAKTATVAADPSLPVLPFNGILVSGRSDIPQPGTTVMLDGLDGLLMYRAPYRIWTGYNSVVISHVVNVGSGVAGIRWYELRQDNTTKVWSIYQQSTYAPADGLYRCMPSIAMDNYGSIALCYAASSSSSVYPSLRYTGRLAGDSLGKMTFAEQTAIAGTGSQTSSSQRFGDYSHTSLDPDGITFWHTGEYVNSTGGGQRATRIYSFQLPSNATGVNEIPDHAEFNVYQNEKRLIVQASKLASNNNVVVDLFDISGKLIKGNTVTPVLNMLETTIDVTSLSKGVYLVRIGNSSFQKVIKVTVN